MTRKQWLVTGAILACVCFAGGAALVAVRSVPAAARLIYGDPPTPTPLPSPDTPPDDPVEWIAFESKRGALGDFEIFVVSSDGSRLGNITNHWADDAAPAWSPDGQKIAFVSWRETLTGKGTLGQGSIYAVDFDPLTGQAKGEPVRVTEGSDDGWPSWSPDGSQIAFHSNRSGDWDIWVVNLDGSGLTNLTEQPGEDRFPSWSPDGTRIAFGSRREGNYDVWVMDADGSNQVNLTQAPARDRHPVWSPDGTQIAFNASRDGNQEIYIMNADGSDQRNLTNTPNYTEGLLSWAPDGRRGVLYSDLPGNKDLFVVDLVTGEWTNITNHPASDEYCAWSPR